MLNGKGNVSEKELYDIFDKAKKVFFVGIGGVSMSSLAEVMYFPQGE